MLNTEETLDGHTVVRTGFNVWARNFEAYCLTCDSEEGAPYAMGEATTDGLEDSIYDHRLGY